MDSQKDFCTSCHAGVLQPGQATFARWYDGSLVVLPGVSSWRCDFCGKVFYDFDILNRLFLLLGTEPDMEEQERWRTVEWGEHWKSELNDRYRI